METQTLKKLTLEQWRNIHIDNKGYDDGKPWMQETYEGAKVYVEVDRSVPPVITSNKYIGLVTPGVQEKGATVMMLINEAFTKSVLDHEDFFYCVEVQGEKYYVQDNGEMGYTAMLPDEY